jgi:hypothetical protein
MHHPADPSLTASRGARLLRAVGARGSLLDALRVVATSWWLAIVAIFVVQQAHLDLHEHRELPILLHLLRDGALAVPAAGIAVIAASLLVAPSPDRMGRARHLDGLIWAVAAAAVFALLSIPGNQLHGALFGAEEEVELSLVADLALDGGLALVGALLALTPIVLVAGPPFQRERPAFKPIPEHAGSTATADQLTGSRI